MSTPEEARKRRMEKIKARANKQDQLAGSLLQGDAGKLNQNPEVQGLSDPQQPSETFGEQNVSTSQNTNNETSNNNIEKEDDVLLEGYLKKDMDVWEQRRYLKKIENERVLYLKTKSFLIIFLSIFSAIVLAYSGLKEHSNFF